MCSYFCDNKRQEDAARARQIRYYRECVNQLPVDPTTHHPENSVLLSNSLGSQSRWVVILYFNVGTSQ
jgi:hypothetical protein